MRDYEVVKDLLVPRDLIDVKVRKQILEKLQPYLDFVFQKFYETLIQNPETSQFVPKESIPRLIKGQKKFLSFILTSELNESFYSEVLKVAQLHVRLGIKDVHMVYGFNVLLLLFCEVFKKEGWDFYPQFLSFLKFVEFLMISAHSKQEKVEFQQRQKLFEAINELYLAFRGHRRAQSAIEKLWFFKDKKKFIEFAKRNGVPLKPEDCAVLRKVNEIKNSGVESPIPVNFDKLERLLTLWIEKINNLFKAIENNDEKRIKETYEDISTISSKISKLFGEPLQDLASTMFLAVNSGIRFLQMITEFLYQSKAVSDESVFLEELKHKIREVFVSALGWAIEKIEFSKELNDESEYDVVQHMEIEDNLLYVGVKLANVPYKIYLKELIGILLQISKIVVFLKERELELKKLADRAEAASRAKDMFLANMSHELRTPLNAIIGFSQILQMRKDIPETIKPYIEKIHIAGKNLLDLVNTILDFAKLEAGKIEMKPQRVNIKEILQEVYSIILPLVQQKGLTFEYPKESSFTIYADPKLIKEVFLNLLSNAVKFTPSGGKVWIDINFSKEENAYVFSVCDTGIGIKREDIPKIFSPFTQLENPMQKSTKGTGLGLAITKRIVELHKGKIWVQSEYGNGTCFFFSIPVTKEIEYFEVVKSQSGSAKNILILEDYSFDIQLFKECLKDDYNLFITNFVQKGLEVLEKEKIDFIILDYFLADGVGTDIVDYLLEKRAKIPLVLLSAEKKIKNLPVWDRYEHIVKKAVKTELKCEELKKILARYLEDS